MISSRGAHLVDPAGRPVTLKGCNLGNLLVLESWMWGGTLKVNGHDFKDQKELFAEFDRRFGHDKTEALMDVWRDSYITARDLQTIKTFGFNVVRLPFVYTLLQDDASPDQLRPDAFVRIDKEVAMCEAAGLYVILDMHGVPGAQSKEGHTGQADVDAFWHHPKNQDRAVLLWRALAEHYKDRSAVAAYDLINEPYGDFHEDVRAELAAVMPKMADAIRSTGDQHVIFYSGPLSGGIGFYGDPHVKGLTNIGFTEHYYPGLFGSKSATETHARLLGAELPAKNAYVQKLGTPYYVGEFNVVLASEDPNRMMRMYYDRFAEYGWPCTMWAYKLISVDGGVGPSAWYMVTNKNAFPKLDAARSSYEEIEAMFKGLATSPVAVNQPLFKALTDSQFEPVPLASYQPMVTAPPTGSQSNPAGYTSRDIGAILAGHTAASGDEVTIHAGGADIIGTTDTFRFVAKPVTGAADLQATISVFSDTNEYAKAGLMARWGSTPESPMVMINVFPDGTIALVNRNRPGGDSKETKTEAGVSLPVQLRLQIADGKATATFRTDRGVWQQAGSVDVPTDAEYLLGVCACAHADGVLTTVKATLGSAGDALLPAAGQGSGSPAGMSLLTNGSFEQQGDDVTQPAGWNHWGDYLQRQTDWASNHDGTCLMGYHHWEIPGDGNSCGLWQNAKAEKGKRYTFTIFAQHDIVDQGKADAETVELRLEGTTPDGQVTLNTRDFAVNKFAAAPGWTKLSVSGTAISETIRVLAVCSASHDANRGGAVKLDDASLTLTTDGR